MIILILIESLSIMYGVREYDYQPHVYNIIENE